MGYEVAISRRPVSWQEGPEITLAEWLAYVEQDPELTLDDTINYDVYWRGPNGEVGWLGYWPHGEIGRKFNKTFIEKMVQIADDLHAVVRGDNDELYLAGGVVLREDDPDALAYLASRLSTDDTAGQDTVSTE